MQNVAHAMAKGDYSVRADETVKGEIGELAKAMNHFAEESSKLEQTRRDYVANVSHEFRTPIASIRAIGETLRDGMVKSDEKKEMFYSGIVRESVRLSRLVDDLLDLSRLQSGKETIRKSEFDLRDVFSNISEIYGRAAEDAGLQFETVIDYEAPARVLSNSDRLEQVAVILMDNAVKYRPEGANVSLELHESGEKYIVSVRNTGSHIPEEDLPYVFDRFYTVDKSHAGGGTGLGLSIAREIIKALGETINVESSDNETVFWFTVAPSE